MARDDRTRDREEKSSQPSTPKSKSQIRFKQARELMAFACLLALLALIVYHAIIPETTWPNRAGDIQLLMLLICGLLGLNLVGDNYRRAARIVGAVLTAYANGFGKKRSESPEKTARDMVTESRKSKRDDRDSEVESSSDGESDSET